MITMVIDPIDGTRAFMVGAPTWSNLIGLTYKESICFRFSKFSSFK